MILYIAVVAICAVLATGDHPTAGSYLFWLLLPSVPVALYVWTTGDRRLLDEPLSFSKVLRAYFREAGWWVLLWMILIVVLTTLIELP